VPDIGPRKVALFWKEAGITNLAGLELAAREGRLRSLPGMGEKSETRILAGIEALSRRSKRMLLDAAWNLAEHWLGWLRSLPGVERAEAAGSLRRWKITVGDLDLVVASNNPQEVMRAFTGHSEVIRISGQGEAKSSVELKSGERIQLWVQPPERFGSLWQYATGSKDHNVRVRETAQKQGWSLSESSLTHEDGRELIFAEEDTLYKALGMQWIAPELREDHGEVQAALAGKLPKLIQRSDLIANLHTHTTWSDGVGSVRVMAEAAIEAGLQVLAITDHSFGLGIAGGLDAQRLLQQRGEIAKVQAEIGDRLLLLQGAEVEVHADGQLDYPDEILAGLDVVVASIHSSLRQPREVITRRLVSVIQNPHVDIIGHPNGRLMPDREGADLDWEQVFAAAQKNGTALEINSYPSRLDLDDAHAQKAAEMGIPLCINCDAHDPREFSSLIFGVEVGRRAWLQPGQVLNAWPKEELLKWLCSRG
jgi:DNA polymerase (family X)